MDECHQPPVSFSTVRDAENAAIKQRRRRFLNEAVECEDVAGLAISGGGIRVATFALGAIQAMANFRPESAGDAASESRQAQLAAYDNLTLSSDSAQHDQHTGILGAFDYLSTVSGGGFIGSWLTSWIYRCAEQAKEDQREAKTESGAAAPAGHSGGSADNVGSGHTADARPACAPASAPALAEVTSKLRLSVSQDKKDSGLAEASEISFLRQYSNYLTPQTGLFSTDTWTIAAIYVRNFLLNVINLVAVALAVCVMVFLLIRGFQNLFTETHDPKLFQYLGWVTAMCAVGAWTFCRCLWNVGRAPRLHRNSKGNGAETRDGSAEMMWTVLWFCVTAAIAVPALAAHADLSQVVTGIPFGSDALRQALGLGVVVGVVHALPGFACLIPQHVVERSSELSRPTWRDRVWSAGCALAVGFISGFVGGLLLYLLFVMPAWDARNEPDLYVVFGPAFVLFTVTMGIAVEVGFLSRSSSVHEREWWARLAAWLLICASGWTVVACIAFYAGPLFDWMGGSARLAMASGAFGISALAAKVGSSGATKHKWPGPFAGLIVRVGPALFLLAVAIGMSTFVRDVVLYSCTSPDRNSGESSEERANLSEPTEAGIGVDRSAEEPGLEPNVLERRDAIGDVLPWTVKERQMLTLGEDEPPVEVTREFRIYPRLISDGVKKTRESLLNANVSLLFWAWCVGPLILAAVLSSRFDINRNSLNRAWANRLIRCYLGASNLQRRPHESTGFDERDDIPLVSLRDSNHPHDRSPRSRVAMWAALWFGLPRWCPPREEADTPDYDGPYHLVNGALNVYRSKDLSRQERHAESFVMSPMYCGYTLAGSLQESEVELTETSDCGATKHAGSYTKTDDYAGQLTLGSAVGISGAAASPNMGYHTMPSLAALMTVFNVRLGWWLPNPARKEKSVLHSDGPLLGLKYLAKELFSSTTAEDKYVYVSDGGHFENLATYELIRRRARFIVIIDGEADGTYEFHGLGSLVRKSRVDFGVDIQISANRIIPFGVDQIRSAKEGVEVSLEDRLGEFNYSLGLIHYPKIKQEEATKGLLIYVKSSLIAADAVEVADLQQYAQTNSAFPHESTADQFFSESQFESYRLLGQRIMARVLAEVLAEPDSAEPKSAESPTEENAEPSPPPVDSSGEKGDASPVPAKPRWAYHLRGAKPDAPLTTTTSRSDGDRPTDADGVFEWDEEMQSGLTMQEQQLQSQLDAFRAHCQRFHRPLSPLSNDD